MNTPTEVVRSFYSKLKAGDAPGALGLLASDIEWTTMWHYKVLGRTPQHVAEGLFKPLMAEWSNFSFTASDFIAEDDVVVSLGTFVGVHGTTGKHVEARYAHAWTVKDEKIIRFRQYIDTLAVAQARQA